MSGEIDSFMIGDIKDPIRFRVDIDPDYESRHTDTDQHTPEDIKAFNDGEWRYVGITVTAVHLYGDLPADATCWSVEYGLPKHDSRAKEGVPRQLIRDVKGQLRQVAEEIAALLAQPDVATISSTHFPRTLGS